MATEKIILAKDELETAKLKLIKAWLKRYFKGKTKMDRLNLWFDFAQFLDRLHDTYFDKFLNEWENYNMVIKVGNNYDESFELNPNIDNVKILTRTVGSPLVTARNTSRGGSCTRPQTGSSTRPSSGTTEMAETLIDHWIKELESIPPTYIDLGKEDFEV